MLSQKREASSMTSREIGKHSLLSSYVSRNSILSLDITGLLLLWGVLIVTGARLDDNYEALEQIVDDVQEVEADDMLEQLVNMMEDPR